MSKLYDKRIVPTVPEYGAGRRPLRQGLAPSYGANGRSAPSTQEQDTGGNHCQPFRQWPDGTPGRASPTWSEIDRARTQGKTPVAKR